jgi:hypothetical protein
MVVKNAPVCLKEFKVEATGRILRNIGGLSERLSLGWRAFAPSDE